MLMISDHKKKKKKIGLINLFGVFCPFQIRQNATVIEAYSKKLWVFFGQFIMCYY